VRLSNASGLAAVLASICRACRRRVGCASAPALPMIVDIEAPPADRTR
jgi:hypothetical protein